MNIPKKFLLASMLLVCSAWTKAETVPGLTLISSTGEKFSFALTERPRIVQELEQYTKYYLVVYSNGKRRARVYLSVFRERERFGKRNTGQSRAAFRG